MKFPWFKLKVYRNIFLVKTIVLKNFLQLNWVRMNTNKVFIGWALKAPLIMSIPDTPYSWVNYSHEESEALLSNLL